MGAFLVKGAGGGMVERHLREHRDDLRGDRQRRAGRRAGITSVRAGAGRDGAGAGKDGPACGIAAAWWSPAPGSAAGPWASQDAIPRAASTGSWYRQPPPAPASAIARRAS
jgi:hypothetical protein